METLKRNENLNNSLRLWPGMVIVILQWSFRFVIPAIFPGVTQIGIMIGVLSFLPVIVWWLFFSKAPKLERWTAIPVMLISLFLSARFLDKSIATSMMGLMYLTYSIPVVSLFFVLWAYAAANFSWRFKFESMIIILLIGSGFWMLLRTEGMDGQAHHQFAWRWSKTYEEMMLSSEQNKVTSLKADSAVLNKEPEWAGFRGSERDGIIHHTMIESDWEKSAPVLMWKHTIGPACSSVAIHGPMLFTQEQRGENEMVTCYDLNTGELIWEHSDSTRFWDSHAGAGPRSTPTICKGKVYTMGATGVLNVLNEKDGSLVWSRDAAKDAGVKIPGWAYCGSPLVVDSLVLVAVSGRILAYDVSSGNQRWTGTDGGESYSSPHLMTIQNIRQVLFMNQEGCTSYNPVDGTVLWKLPMTGVPILQPALFGGNNLMISAVSTTGSIGIKHFVVSNGAGGWSLKELLTSDKLKPYFNDFVVHKGHVYGFEGPVLECVDISNGNRTWRGGRYAGQLLLLADQDLLLVLSEKGDLALVSATPGKFNEIAKFPGITGRTWNHPVLDGNILVIRNFREIAAFRLVVKQN